MRGPLVLDTSVWINAVDDPSHLKEFRRAGYGMAIADEAVHELVAGVVSAAEHGDDATYARRRAACGQVTAFASVPTQPIGCHFARLCGLDTGPLLDLRSLVRDVARSRDIGTFRSKMGPERRDGSSFRDWPESRDARRARWCESINAAFSTHGGARGSVDTKGYAEAKAAPLVEGNRSLVRIEVEEIREALLELGRPTTLPVEVLIDRLRPHLTVFLEVFREAYLDRFEGPHNQNCKRIRFEKNDWNDLAQIRYLQDSSIWVTSDARWSMIAKRTRFASRIVVPDEVPLHFPPAAPDVVPFSHRASVLPG